MANVQLTPIQQDYKKLVDTKTQLRDNALGRITQIRKEVTALHIEEAHLEDIVKDLNNK